MENRERLKWIIPEKMHNTNEKEMFPLSEKKNTNTCIVERGNENSFKIPFKIVYHMV